MIQTESGDIKQKELHLTNGHIYTITRHDGSKFEGSFEHIASNTPSDETLTFKNTATGEQIEVPLRSATIEYEGPPEHKKLVESAPKSDIPGREIRKPEENVPPPPISRSAR